MTALRWLFPLATLGAGAILAALAAHETPRILSTLALVLTLAALAAAIPH
ncbi:hypothetical protein [Streptomyces nitrosporeus]|nr:hypothetical protein [Streptomyces nitrosporeus]GGY81281.1 hypothetical protein GCM10010327_09910 [Streptomyces nitrosporeus]